MSKYTRCFICNQLLLINKYNKLEGYDEFEKLFDELQFLELNIDKREETKSATQFLECINLISFLTNSDGKPPFTRNFPFSH